MIFYNSLRLIDVNAILNFDSFYLTLLLDGLNMKFNKFLNIILVSNVSNILLFIEKLEFLCLLFIA